VPPSSYVADELDTFRFWDASTGFESDRWRGFIFVNNLNDADPVVSKRTTQIDRAQGRTYGVRLIARF
jgi:hypothetical protein